MKHSNFFTVGFLLLLMIFSSCASGKKARIREQKVSAVITTAKSYTGTPYKYGGTSRAGLDCSALVIKSFNEVNVDLPRSSLDQSKEGKKLKIHQLKSGDLVFFATTKKRRLVSHVGIVTQVSKDQIKFIHASTTAGVVESDLKKEYYAKRFRFGRRIID